jgi:hypothetical protein
MDIFTYSKTPGANLVQGRGHGHFDVATRLKILRRVGIEFLLDTEQEELNNMEI